jgi:mannose-6-phosphate isomerase class I
MPLLLNFLRMDVGEAFYMGANEPHAYLKGDLMEVRIDRTLPVFYH